MTLMDRLWFNWLLFNSQTEGNPWAHKLRTQGQVTTLEICEAAAGSTDLAYKMIRELREALFFLDVIKTPTHLNTLYKAVLTWHRMRERGVA